MDETLDFEPMSGAIISEAFAGGGGVLGGGDCNLQQKEYK